MDDELRRLAETTEATFRRVHTDVFEGDPAANPRLKVEVVDPERVEGIPTCVLVTPWTLNGMWFPGGQTFPDRLIVAGRPKPVFANELPDLGPYLSVNLVSDVSRLESPAQARTIATTLGESFREAIRRIVEEAQVADPGRRRLLRGR